MNEKYLWDKTGEDFEIKKLENALQALRHYSDIVPLIAVKAKVEKKPLFKFFPFAVPAMACLVFVLLAVGFWMRTSNDNSPEIAGTVVQLQDITQPTDNPLVILPATILNPKHVRFKEKPATRQEIKKNPKTRSAYIRVNAVTERNSKKTNSTDVLTKEEKYAYDRLMTALAITSSQLKLVKDRIQGIEDQTAVVKNGQ